MGLGTILIILLVLLLLGVIPVWPYAAGWGHGPVSVLGVVLVIVVVLVLSGWL
jgi:hypothetical protein